MDNRRGMVALFALILIGLVAGIVYCAVPRKQPSTAPPAPPALVPAQEQEDRYKKNDGYIVPPQANEPAWPSPTESDAVAKAGHAAFTGGYQYEVRGADGARRSGVVVAGTITLDRGLIELFGCAEGGKEYESVLRFECDVQSLDQALRLTGAKPGPLRPKEAGGPTGARLVMLVQWTAGGKTVTYRAEDLILSSRIDKPMPRVGWAYVGHWADVPDPTAANGKTYRILSATGTRSIVTTYHDAGTLLDNPLVEAELDKDAAETLFAANYMLLPEPGTKVLVILRAPTADEAKAIADAEKELSK